VMSKFGKIARYFLLVVSVLGIVLVLKFLNDDIGPSDSLGEASDNCARGELPTVPSNSGMVATAHFTSCTYGFAHGLETTYVYVHKAGEKDGRKFLVFRFDNGGHLDEPQITWSNNLNLHISVAAVGEVTKQIVSIDGVKISYSILKEDLSREESSRIRMHYARILFAWLIFQAGVCALTVRSILKQKRQQRQHVDEDRFDRNNYLRVGF
jgi:hypothetical protein